MNINCLNFSLDSECSGNLHLCNKINGLHSFLNQKFGSEFNNIDIIFVKFANLDKILKIHNELLVEFDKLSTEVTSDGQTFSIAYNIINQLAKIKLIEYDVKFYISHNSHTKLMYPTDNCYFDLIYLGDEGAVSGLYWDKFDSIAYRFSTEKWSNKLSGDRFLDIILPYDDYIKLITAYVYFGKQANIFENVIFCKVY